MHYFFRRSDGVHIATAHLPQGIDLRWKGIADNELGGIAAHIVVQSDERLRQGFDIFWDEPQGVRFVPNPRVVAREQLKASRNVKLALLGLTSDEIGTIN